MPRGPWLPATRRWMEGGRDSLRRISLEQMTLITAVSKAAVRRCALENAAVGNGAGT